MPVNVTGVKELQKAMKNIDPEMNKSMRASIKAAMIPIRDNARGFAPSNGAMLSGWTKPLSSFALNYRPFPKYDQNVVKSGIVYREGSNKKNQSGFKAIFYIANISAAGAIYETAGRVNPNGQLWRGRKASDSNHDISHSNNPRAGSQFIQSMGGQSTMKGSLKQRGRLIYKAWAEDQGRVYPKVINAIDQVAKRFNRETEIREAFLGKAA